MKKKKPRVSLQYLLGVALTTTPRKRTAKDRARMLKAVKAKLKAPAKG